MGSGLIASNPSPHLSTISKKGFINLRSETVVMVAVVVEVVDVVAVVGGVGVVATDIGAGPRAAPQPGLV